jgi:hypothetical protein
MHAAKRAAADKRGAVMSERDEQRLEDEDAPETSEGAEESADVEGHKLHHGAAEPAGAEMPKHKPYH